MGLGHDSLVPENLLRLVGVPVQQQQLRNCKLDCPKDKPDPSSPQKHPLENRVLVVKDSLGSNQPPNDGGGEQSGFVGTGELHGVVFGANVVDGELELHDSETNQPIDQRGPQLDQTNAPGRQDVRVVGGFLVGGVDHGLVCHLNNQSLGGAEGLE